ncbi:MAG: hypothetical protein D6B25_09905, partial [Desulfobulbaceae bacterium]
KNGVCPLFSAYLFNISRKIFRLSELVKNPFHVLPSEQDKNDYCLTYCIYIVFIFDITKTIK